ncbi:multidrug efflux SMR transporter [Pseudomonas aeruginosa]|uniref:DMT family transporter n=1 Tax=Pseudomonas aeruginosa TaxID=287 RepID=UPI00101B081A|nr:multidrug efflux SMR transporter [Pseudomonas aeruginosa]EKU2931623.1 multidrug efflux SMR transporter [Pseudomonas aeruginosa]EKU2932470.1 multidrug efflux SMR transporter [Pseudomonas aeruginosa]EMB2825341.1 multidrug efflux SMR transporter [Pseudomonas aeruginosa]EMB2825621.1 multidrug efflux SMR transporter [Pseudomonas aeruginosa]MCU9231517.1 multidrug efflux SMR transporter [Pseudomonas aeruginosa]
MNNWLFLAVAIFGEVAATSALKASEGFTKPLPSILVVLGYGLAFYFLSLALKTIPMGIAYAVWAGLGIVLVTAVAWVFYGQKLDIWAFIGMAMIVGGVAVLNLLSKGSAH